VLKEAEDKEIRQLKLGRLDNPPVTITKIIEEECEKRQISQKELTSGSRRSKISQARASIAYRIVEERGASAAEIAKHMGVNTSGITRAIGKLEEQKMDKLCTSYAT